MNKNKLHRKLSLVLALSLLAPTVTAISVAPTRLNAQESVVNTSGEVSIENKIPDKNLRAVIKKELGLKENQVITNKNILNLKQLMAIEEDIKSLDGLNYAKNLEDLEITSNQGIKIEPSTFKGLVKLENLSLEDNGLTSIDPETFKGLINLKELYLSENALTSIDSKVFKDLLNLHTLFLDGQEYTIKAQNRIIELPKPINEHKYTKYNPTDKYKIQGNKVILYKDYNGLQIKVKFTTNILGRLEDCEDSQEDGLNGTITIDTSGLSDLKTPNYWIFKIGDYNYKYVTPDRTIMHKADIKPFIKNGRTYLPLRFVGEALGLEVNYDNTEKVATFKDGSMTLKINIQLKEATADGYKYTLRFIDPVIENNRILVPVSSIGKVFNKTVSNVTENKKTDIVWNNDTKEVIIYNYK